MARYSVRRIAGALYRRRLDLVRGVQFRSATRQPLQSMVLFDCFNGKSVGDSPLDLCLELQRTHPELKLVWAVNLGLQSPAGTESVVVGSKDWLAALAQARYLVSNTNLPRFFQKRAGQVVVQTWHGTPLKKLVHDIESGITASYLADMDRDSGRWDYLISPSPFYSERMRQAFHYRGKILETGYPRNDRLATADADERNRIRGKLGITDPKQTVVLYAPTWRDYERDAYGNWTSVKYLEANDVTVDNLVLLYRGHQITSNTHQPEVDPRVLDVTSYPDIAELCVAADVLVTDYSSIMFDFAVLDRPMVFLVPDFERYQAERGMYFDFRGSAPGPICQTAAEVMQKLSQLPAVAAEYALARQEWRRKFAPWDDGHAAARVVQEVWPASAN